MRPLILPILATAALLALTGCSTESLPADQQATIEPTPGLTPDDLADHTQQTFNITWAVTSEADRDAYCTSVALLGPDAAADEMAQGAGYDDSLDWNQMAELLQAECALR